MSDLIHDAAGACEPGYHRRLPSPSNRCRCGTLREDDDGRLDVVNVALHPALLPAFEDWLAGRSLHLSPPIPTGEEGQVFHVVVPDDSLMQQATSLKTESSITCPKCGRTSHNPNDVEQRYCGACHEFHEAMRL